MKKSDDNEFHKPVLLQEVVDLLKIEPDHWYLDATVGGGGHAAAIVQHGGRLVGIDQDKQALTAAKKRLKSVCPGASWQLLSGNFRDLAGLAGRAKVAKFAGILFDLGVSAYQLGGHNRGFSFQHDEPLDMRMDPENQSVTAKDLVNGLGRKELHDLFKKFSGERLARSIADSIVRTRRVKPIDTTGELKSLAEAVYRQRRYRTRLHPATKVFQALRIAVNDELAALSEALGAVEGLLDQKGRLAVISFHEGEDRLVKQRFRFWIDSGRAVTIDKQPITPALLERRINPRARSARLRVLEWQNDTN